MHSLDDVSIIEKIDTENMYHKIIHLPEQILQAYQKPVIHNQDKANFASSVKKIMICGMGGSAISGDLARVSFPGLNIEVTKDYSFSHVNQDTFVILLSYSGNTEETVNCAELAMQKTSMVAAITSGGAIKEKLSELFLWIELSPGLPPRSAIGNLFFSLVKILEVTKIIESQEEVVKKTVSNLVQKANALSQNQLTNMNLAKISAEQLQGKIPIIYAVNPSLAPLAYRWKCQINENAKYPAFCHIFPEMNHNEIEGWESPEFKDTFIPIFLTKFNENANYKKRVDAFKKILQKQSILSLDFYVEGNSTIEQLFSLIYLGDMISFYLAILLQTNPTKINYIDFLKKEIS